jgi:sugar (glycoside-pentoside-hexuronide) transporter
METLRKERLSYYMFAFGQIIFYMIMTSYLQIFMTDIAIPATAVGVILLVARIWDAVNDPMFGVIVNKSKLKGGKYKPWLKISPILIFAFTVLLFAVPSGISIGIKTGIAAVFYIGWGMSYTVCDVPYFSVTTAMSSQISERNHIISRAKLFTMIGSAITILLVPLAYPAIGWPVSIAIFSVAALLCMLPLGRVAQERRRGSDEAPTLKAIISAVAKNKFLLVFCLAFIVGNITNTILIVNGYFAIYCLGGPHMIPVVTLVPMVFAGIFIGFVPLIIKKVDKFNIYLIAMVINVIISIVMYFVGYSSLLVYLVLATIRSVAFSFTSNFITLFIIDCAEYGLYKTGEDITAVTISLQTFTVKALSALAGALTMFILGYVGFVDGAGVVQPPVVLDAIWVLNSIFPAIGTVVAFFILLFGYKLRDRDVQIMAEVNSGKLDREQAETMISGKLV